MHCIEGPITCLGRRSVSEVLPLEYKLVRRDAHHVTG